MVVCSGGGPQRGANSVKACGGQPLHQRCSWGPRSAGLSPSRHRQPSLLACTSRSPLSAHPQTDVDGGEQSFAGGAGKVPPAKALPELGR